MATKGPKTTFDVEARDKTSKGLLSVNRNLDKTSKKADKLAGRFRNVARATVVMEGPLGGTAGRLSAMATMFNSVGLGTIAFGIGLAGLTAAVGKSLVRFAEFEKSQLKIQTLLKTTNGAVGLTTKELSDMATRIGISTLESVEGVREAQGTLLTFKGIGADTFGTVMEMATNMAAVNPSQGLVQSVLQLGKALEDPAANMGALRRSGVSFTNSQKAMIVAMKESGDAAGAQTEMLALLEGQMGGAGAAQGGGLAGAADELTERWGLMLEAFATSGAGDIATKMLKGMAGALESITLVLNPEGTAGLLAVNEKMLKNRTEYNRLEEEGYFWTKARRAVLQDGFRAQQGTRDEILKQMALEREQVVLARAKGKETQKQISLKQAEGRAEEDAAAKAKAAVIQKGKDKKGASSYGQKLLDEADKLKLSLMDKTLQEDIYRSDKMTKLNAQLEAELITQADYDARKAAAYYTHETNLTAIKAEESDKRNDAELEQQQKSIAMTKTSLNDMSVLMSSHSKKLFEVGKVAAIANALIKGYESVLNSYAAGTKIGGPPVGAIFAAVAGAATAVQIQKIRSSKMAAREHGGSVIAGRDYLVGERGPELFTAPRSGQIINNATTSNIGGSSLTVNNYNTFEADDSFIQRNAAKIVNVVTDKMTEEGWSFA